MRENTWLKDAVIYQIYPQSFSDSNGDGIGDIQGVIDKLDYIESLGVDAIWFNNIKKKKKVDDGYDVDDYQRIASRYGTNVAGHTSIDHPWFLK